ncbi:hypothetical protein CYLTODRAFT_406823 [Cylindrobasidium torrendii FP15055 ss-10]|uniref:Uncharacterized protein n=1 Tax=Cylindrobasidium torrendii FP15055 ss-10 TaxID=1314674 RepID=A0A0D7BUF4_9AGAR|nr:hypothetical protein CYLTODRAFT_406823 [Cylindrobasidium torrendii FP15055 ss-10]
MQRGPSKAQPPRYARTAGDGTWTVGILRATRQTDRGWKYLIEYAEKVKIEHYATELIEVAGGFADLKHPLPSASLRKPRSTHTRLTTGQLLNDQPPRTIGGSIPFDPQKDHHSRRRARPDVLQKNRPEGPSSKHPQSLIITIKPSLIRFERLPLRKFAGVYIAKQSKKEMVVPGIILIGRQQ